MARKTSTPTLRLVRGLLLVALVGFVALVFVLYRFGRSGMPVEETTERRADETESSRPAVMSGSGFDYTISQDEKPIARIRAERIVSEEEDEVVLEGLNPVEVYREGGTVYRIFSDRGTYNLHTQETVLAGNVRLEGSRGLVLETAGLSMRERADIVTSNSPVRFRMAGEFRGSARQMEADLERDLFMLSDAVEVTSVSTERDALQLTAKRLAFHRAGGFIRAVGDVRFQHAGSFLRAAYMEFFLTDDERHLRYIAARQGVRGSFLKRFGLQLVRSVELEGHELAVVLDPATGDPIEAEIRSPDAVARLASIDEGALVRQLVAPVLQARFEDGDVRYAEAVGLVHLREFPAFDPGYLLTWGCGERAEVWLDPAGQVRQARFYERVEFRQAGGLVNADRIDLSPDSAEMTMVGSPARFVSADGELTAPTLVRRTETGEVRATGGVRGRFDGGGGISVGGAEGSIRMESSEATWNPTTESFRFYDDVRVWQQENLLLAQEVENFTSRDLIVARGGVKTILEPQRDGESDPAETAETTEASESTDRDAADLANEPIHISADWMEYELDSRIARYHDRVLMTQGGRRMTCGTAEALLAEGGGIETLDCTGNARVDDSVAGRTVSGDNALYRVERGEILFRGTPVRMTGEKGERVEGGTLVYDLKTGGARITPQSATEAETIPPAATNSGDGP
ncbi:MAG: LPS export ABC transporter periplasmic protein LptC [Thermoanaerobaculia bacterium]|nr:LPS export ABC transporter periplasmic protein LptC [Thermoanaerobaculia bacterium]